MGVFANTFNAIANAIKAKDGGGDMTPAQMAGRIAALPSLDESIPEGGWINDGNTHFWMNYPPNMYGQDYEETLNIGRSSNYTATVYWGDGSFNTVTNGKINLNHIYAGSSNGGRFRIDIVSDDLTYLWHSGNDYSIFGNQGYIYPFVTHVETGSLISTLQYAFWNCCVLRGVKFNADVNLNTNSFRNCYKLLKIHGNGKIKTLGESVFAGCLDLASIYKIETESIGNNCFSGCPNVRNFDFDGVTYFGSGAFSGGTFVGLLKKINIPSSLGSIGDQCFRDSGIMSLDLSNTTISSIPSYAFWGISRSYNTKYYSNLISLDLPSTITSIGQNAIQGFQIPSTTVSKIICRAINPPTIESNSINAGINKIYVPNESVDAYKTATNWSAYASKIEAIQE